MGTATQGARLDGGEVQPCSWALLSEAGSFAEAGSGGKAGFEGVKGLRQPLRGRESCIRVSERTAVQIRVLQVK